MKLTDALLLAVVQGIAEWLPVSSSGHLVLFRYLFSMESGISYDIFLHLSALFVIIVFFRKDIVQIIKALVRREKKTGEYRLFINIINATLITGISGIFLRPHMEALSRIEIIPFTFLFTSLLLFASAIRNGKGKINTKSALFIGIMQSFALLPGISRSGATISAAKLAGADSEEAFRFSFLAAVPAIAGAILLEIKKLEMMPPALLLTGFAISLALGLVSLFFLQKILVRKKFHLFGLYTLALSFLLFLFR
ncbi:MAG TPA: undecaprenyl-diphosphate phosphatase [bacterium]|nr:undecaprenyl-diphosphate phosphatase [bacterium]